MVDSVDAGQGKEPLRAPPRHDDGPTMSSPISLVPTLSDADSEVELTAWDCRVRVRCGEIPCVAETESGGATGLPSCTSLRLAPLRRGTRDAAAPAS